MQASTYIKKIEAVLGRLHPTTARCLTLLDTEQKKLGVSGSAGEIGVHNGRLLILLALLEENSFAIDIFDDEKNLDNSGYGNRLAFERNLKRYGVSTQIIQQDSRDLTSNDFPGPVRLFSVDGSHIAEPTLNDMRLTDATMADGGFTALDDYFNPRWPGVSVGANRFA